MLPQGSSNSNASSPLGPIQSSHMRKLFVSLISTMNASFPDYDFCDVGPESFVHEVCVCVCVCVCACVCGVLIIILPYNHFTVDS